MFFTKSLFILFLVTGSWLNTSIAETHSYTMKGKVMDTSGNWLNDARVSLRKFGVVVQSDPNGNFVLSFSTPKALIERKGQVIDYLEADKEGHMGKSIKITSLKKFEKSTQVTIELEPNPVKGNTLGFSTRMSLDNTLGVVAIKVKDTVKVSDHDIPVKTLSSAISTMKAQSDSINSRQVQFHVYIDPTVKKVRAAFYLSRHGIGNVEHPVLRKFAKEEKVALIGLVGDPVQRGFYPTSIIDKHIKKLATMSKHTELTNVPILTFGHSNGTGFAACLASDRPERVIGWISYHAGVNHYLQLPQTEHVPSLVMCGGIDNWFRKYRQDKTVNSMRTKRNALMSLTMEASVGHGPKDKTGTWTYIVEFCKAAMDVRLKDDGTLKPIDIKTGWLGEVYDIDKGGPQKLLVTPYKSYKGDKSKANWFPNETFAKTWQAYVNKK